MKKFAIGDIHGRLDKLDMLVEKISPTSNDTLIFLGDYIDRGLKSKEVVEYLIQLSKNINCVFLTGNHEQMMLDYIEDKTKTIFIRDLWINNGGLTTYDSYVGSKFSHTDKDLELLKQSIKHLNFYNNLLFYHEDDNYIYVHAGVKKGIPLDQQNQEDLIWIRHEFILLDTGLSKKVIFGHTPFKKPLVHFDKIGIDTKAFDTFGKLTAIQLPEEIFIQV
jgi:serine/threonine protein phosphatase 1